MGEWVRFISDALWTNAFSIVRVSESLVISFSQQKLSEAIIKGEYPRPEHRWQKISPDGTNLLEGMLCVSPEKRLTIQEVIKHPWLA